MFISFLLSTFLGTAEAVPLQLTQQGRSLDNKQPNIPAPFTNIRRLNDACGSVGCHVGGLVRFGVPFEAAEGVLVVW